MFRVGIYIYIFLVLLGVNTQGGSFFFWVCWAHKGGSVPKIKGWNLNTGPVRGGDSGLGNHDFSVPSGNFRGCNIATTCRGPRHLSLMEAKQKQQEVAMKAMEEKWHPQMPPDGGVGRLNSGALILKKH